MMRFAHRIWELLKPYRSRLGLGIVAGILSGLMEPVLMLAVKLVMDVLFPTQGAAALLYTPSWFPAAWRQWVTQTIDTITGDVSGSRLGLVLVVATIPGAMFLRGVFTYLNVYCLQWASIRAIADLRTRLFNHLVRLPLQVVHAGSTGEWMSRIANDTNALQYIMSSGISVVVRDPVKLASLLALLLWQNPRLTLVSLVLFPVCVIPIVVYSRKVRRASAAIQDQYAAIGRIMQEAFTGNRILKAYNLEDRTAKQFDQTTRAFLGNYMRVVRSIEIPGPLMEVAGAIGVALFFFLIAGSTRSNISAGDLLQFVGSIFLMYQPIKGLTRLHSQMEQARASSERVFELLAIQSQLNDPPQPKLLHARGAAIEFDRVTFSYGDRRVLKDVSFTIRAGQLVALVGGSGAGKTTVTNLLLRFYDPQHGAVRIGGTDIRDVTQATLRSQIAVVTQEVILFNDTIRNNIALGRPGATDAQIIEAARHAHADTFIREKPDGYDAVIGEAGVTLSGGQRQRIAIARAILRDAPILILDEATSALDSESERAVHQALEQLMHGRTTLCIAHRLSTVHNADRIVVLDHGRIADTGTHAELLERDGIYRKLHDLQFADIEVAP
jgi:subfamily B ATP-binding cassette protein MsbA